MPSDKRLDWFQDILDNITRIERFTAGLDYSTFHVDEEKVFAVLHALLIISEAARRLGVDAELLAPGQRWRDIRGIGNILRHEYSAVDLGEIWHIIGNDLPSLKIAVERAIISLRTGS